MASVGSLGRDGANESVEYIDVRNVQFINTTNGARIKTWKVSLPVFFVTITKKLSPPADYIVSSHCRVGEVTRNPSPTPT